MLELSHNYFPLTLGKGKPLYIRSIYSLSVPTVKVDFVPNCLSLKTQGHFSILTLLKGQDIFRLCPNYFLPT